MGDPRVPACPGGRGEKPRAPVPPDRSHPPGVFLPLLAIALALHPARGEDLLIDFNSLSQDGGPHLQEGYQPYDARHEVSVDFLAPRDYQAFGTTVSLQVSWPDTTANSVQQMIDRAASFDANWQGAKIDLLTDWIGADTRTSEGGNGNFDGASGTPTRLVFRFAGLPAGTYAYRSYHHDTEHIHTRFGVEISTDGGNTFTGIEGGFRISDSTPSGSPASPATYDGSAEPDPAELPSTVNFEFTAGDGADVLVRYTPFSEAAGVHVQFMVVNGLEVRAPANAEPPVDLWLSSATVARTAVEGSVVGIFQTDDPTPGETFTYQLVDGPGSAANADFEIEGDRLLLARHADDRQPGDELSIRVRSTDAAGGWVERIFTLMVIDDADGDGLDDSWELFHFGSLDPEPGDDPDGDGLDHAGEFARGTSPVNPDTDGDGLTDGDEVNVYLTDPLDPDSDGDGLPDGDEVQTHGTNPLLADSDGDGYDDATEIAHGTDPLDPRSRPSILLPLRISEFLASNDTGIRDGFGSREDWLEIHNPNSEPVDLEGYRLTDSLQDMGKWIFPPVTVPAGGYLVVFASGRDGLDPQGALHASFRLSAGGEYLALVRPDGLVEDAFAPLFPPQFADISFGRDSTTGELRYFATPTPGGANGAGYEGVVEPPVFSVPRGFHDEPFALHLASPTPGAAIRYTTDGTKPDAGRGEWFSGEAIPVATTGHVRAAAFREGWLSLPAVTHSYIFVDHVALQSADPPGWPADWGFSSDAGTVVPADYEMDPRVVDGALPGYGIREALLDIPSVSITLPMADFIVPPGGIYASPLERVEKECSVEYLLPDGSPGFQTDCKVEVHGNASRRPARMQKHSLRLTFSSAVGPAKLRFPLFPDSPVDRFNKLVLRACFTDSWGLVSWDPARYRPNDSQYLRDVWMKRSFAEMGQPSSHGRFVHLYVNGLYFGLHDLTERLEDDFFADHLGGEEEHWEVNADFAGGTPRWTQMMALAQSADIASPAGYAAIQAYLDLENFADYMLLHFYADAEDWPHKNGYAAANAASGDGKFRFFVWDQEIALDKFSWNRYNSNPGSHSPGTLFQRLRLNPEFRLLFADRVQRHFINPGALSLDGSRNRYLDLASRIDKAIVAESARWGDVQAKTPYGSTVQQPSPLTNRDHDAYPPAPHAGSPGGIYFTREDSWLVEQDNIVNHHLPIIHSTTDSRGLLQELRANQLFPPHDAPRFELTMQPDGTGRLAMHAPLGLVHFTLDGSDPREPTSGDPSPESDIYLAPVVVDGRLLVKARARLSDGTWSALQEESFSTLPHFAEFLPAGDGVWNSDENWNPPPFPDGAGEGARIAAPAGSNRNIDLGQAVTIGRIEFNHPENPFRNRLRSLDPNHVLTFDSPDGPSLHVNGSGAGWAELDLSSDVYLTSDLLLEVDHPNGDPEYGALRLRGRWTGPGGLVKTGPGTASLTGDGKLWSGATVVREGVLKVTESAVPLQSASIEVESGGQLRLYSTGPFANPRTHTFGGPLLLAGPGAANSPGALRHDPGAGANRSVITNPIVFPEPAHLHVEGAGNRLDLAGALSGPGGWTKTGEGTLAVGTDSPGHAAPVVVSAGTLDLRGRLASDVDLSEGAVLRGTGSCGAVSGNGRLAPDIGILTTTSLSGSLEAELAARHDAAATIATRTLVSPLAALHIYLDVAEPQPGDIFRGGLMLPAGADWRTAIIDSRPLVFRPDTAGTHFHDGRSWSVLSNANLTRSATTFDFGTEEVPAEILEIRIGGAPTHYASWQRGVFSEDELADPEVSAPDASPFADGARNLLRYALGADSRDAMMDPPVLEWHDGGLGFGFSFDPARFDIIYQVERTDNLLDWSDPVVLFNSAIHAATPDANGRLRIQDDTPPASQRFYRLKVFLVE